MTEIHYRPGEWRAAVTPQGVAVLPATIEADMLGRIWSSLGAGHGLGAVLESLTGAFGTSLRAIPPFAVVTFGADEVRLAVRGPIEIDVVETDASYGVSGAEVTTWSERVVRNPTSLVVRTDAPGGEAAYGVADAIVLCAELTLAFAASPSLSSSSVSPLSSLASRPSAREHLAPSADGVAASEVVPEETIVPPEQAAAEVPTAAPSAPSIDDEVAEYTQTELPDDAYDHLWGATVVKSVEHAAVREVDEPEDDDERARAHAAPSPSRASADEAEGSAAPAATADGNGFAPPATSPAPASAPTAWTAPPPTGLIDSVPGFGGVGAPSSSEAWPSTTSSAPVAPSDDHDGLTVTVSELEAMRQLGAADATATATASASADSDAPAQAAGAGRMILSTGESYPLDHPIVIGRRPRANRVQADQVPVLVTVASPEQDISRNHLEVRIEGRHVLAVDLDTTNGSVLHRAGTPPLRLAPSEPVLLLSDDVIDLGDGVTVLFEDLP